MTSIFFPAFSNKIQKSCLVSSPVWTCGSWRISLLRFLTECVVKGERTSIYSILRCGRFSVWVYIVLFRVVHYSCMVFRQCQLGDRFSRPPTVSGLETLFYWSPCSRFTVCLNGTFGCFCRGYEKRFNTSIAAYFSHCFSFNYLFTDYYDNWQPPSDSAKLIFGNVSEDSLVQMQRWMQETIAEIYE